MPPRRARRKDSSAANALPSHTETKDWCEKRLLLRQTRPQVCLSLPGEHKLIVFLPRTQFGTIQSLNSKITITTLTIALHILGADALVPHSLLVELHGHAGIAPVSGCIGYVCVHTIPLFCFVIFFGDHTTHNNQPTCTATISR
eukprot:m.123262 g.123262  ORF g.123262 m.123262 type:complete len:144 (+) comp14617_c8_seq1:424-855(+)